MTELPSDESLPQCQCGRTREEINSSVHVTATSTYNGIGWFLILFGITAPPTSVIFRCTQCNEIIEVNRDPKILKQYA